MSFKERNTLSGLPHQRSAFARYLPPSKPTSTDALGAHSSAMEFSKPDGLLMSHRAGHGEHTNAQKAALQAHGFSTGPTAHPHKRMPRNPTRTSTNLLYRCTFSLVRTFKMVNPKFGYNEQSNPRRVLTKPSERADNQGYDNKDHDYILYVHDIISGPRAPNRYQVLDLLGKGTFGQVVKCLDLETNEYVAVKIVKNLPAFHSQGLVEVKLLQTLNSKYDSDIFPMVRMMDNFIFRNHLCLVFELLNVSLYELIRQNQFRGLSVQLVSIFTKQILTAMVALHQSRIIHCDLKPENILLEDASSPNLKVIDFGSACFDNQAVYTYIQSRFYRSPEVILGLPYKMSIDIWSLGCIVFELFVGLPLFPGLSQHRMLMRFIKFLGNPPYRMLVEAKDTSKFFNRVGHTGTNADFVLKTDEEYSRHIAALTGNKPVAAQPFRDYYKAGTIQQIVLGYEYKSGLSKAEREEETAMRKAMLSFLDCVLPWEPEARWTPEELLTHPFVTGQPCPDGFLNRPSKALCNQLNPLLAHNNALLAAAAAAAAATSPTSGMTTPVGTSMAALSAHHHSHTSQAHGSHASSQQFSSASSRDMDEDMEEDIGTSDHSSYMTVETRSAASSAASTSSDEATASTSQRDMMIQDSDRSSSMSASTNPSNATSSMDTSSHLLASSHRHHMQVGSETAQQTHNHPLRFSSSSIASSTASRDHHVGTGMRSGTTGSSGFANSSQSHNQSSGRGDGSMIHLYSGMPSNAGHHFNGMSHTGSIPAMSLASGFGSSHTSSSSGMAHTSNSFNTGTRAMSGPLLSQKHGSGKVPSLPGLGSSPSTSNSFMSGQSPFYAKVGLSPRGAIDPVTGLSTPGNPLMVPSDLQLLGNSNSGIDMSVDDTEAMGSSFSSPRTNLDQPHQNPDSHPGTTSTRSTTGYGSGKRVHSKAGSTGAPTDFASLSPRSGSSPKRHKHASAGSSSTSSSPRINAGRRHSGAQPLNASYSGSPASQNPLIAPRNYSPFVDESISLMELSTPTGSAWQEPLLGLDVTSFSPANNMMLHPNQLQTQQHVMTTGTGANKAGTSGFSAASAQAANQAQFQRARLAGTDMMVDMNYMGAPTNAAVAGGPTQHNIFPSASFGSIPQQSQAASQTQLPHRLGGLANSTGSVPNSLHSSSQIPPVLSSQVLSGAQPPIPTMFTAYSTSQANPAASGHAMPNVNAFPNMHHQALPGQGAPGSFGRIDASGDLDDSLAFTWDHPSEENFAARNFAGSHAQGASGSQHAYTLAQQHQRQGQAYNDGGNSQSSFAAALASSAAQSGAAHARSMHQGVNDGSGAPGSGQYGGYGATPNSSGRSAFTGSGGLAVPGQPAHPMTGMAASGSGGPMPSSYGSVGSTGVFPSNFGLGVSPYDPSGHHFFSGSFSSASSLAQPTLGSSVSSAGQSHWGAYEASSYGSYDAPNSTSYSGYSSLQTGLPTLSSSFLVSPSSDPNSFSKRANAQNQHSGPGIIPSKQSALSSSPTSRAFRRNQDSMQ